MGLGLPGGSSGWDPNEEGPVQLRSQIKEKNFLKGGAFSLALHLVLALGEPDISEGKS